MSRPLTRRLVQLRPSEAPDGAGGVTRGWTEGAAHWGHVALRSGGLRRSEWGGRERVRVRITIHALPEGDPSRPRPGERLREGMRLWAVDAVHPEDLRGRFLTVFASAVEEGAA